MEEFATALEESFPGPLDRWKHFARKTNKTAEWLESHSDEMTPVIVEKRNALGASKACHSKRNLRALRAACRKVWQTTRRCAKDYRLQPCSHIRSVAVAGNINKEENSPSEVRHRRLRWNTGCNATQRYLQKKHWTPSNALLCWRSLTVIQTLKQLNTALAFARQRTWKWQHSYRSPEVLQRKHHLWATWNPLSVLKRRWSETGHDECKHRQPVQEQRR